MIAGAHGLIFESTAHTYLLRDQRLISVTDSLRTAGLIDLQWCTSRARWVGSVVHEGCRLINKGTLNWESVHPDCVGYLRSFEKFLPLSGFQVAGFEKPIHHPGLLYAGMPDLWGIFNGSWAVIDYKTGPVQDWCALQTALYVMALIETIPWWWSAPGHANMPPQSPYLWKRFGMRLMADGTLPKLSAFTDVGDFGLAASIVSMSNWKINHNYDLWRKNDNGLD